MLSALDCERSAFEDCAHDNKPCTTSEHFEAGSHLFVRFEGAVASAALSLAWPKRSAYDSSEGCRTGSFEDHALPLVSRRQKLGKQLCKVKLL